MNGEKSLAQRPQQIGQTVVVDLMHELQQTA
jgi:hypothetical protein